MACQTGEKLAALERIHHRAFHLAEVQCDVALRQARINLLQRIEGAEVNNINSGAHQNDVCQLRLQAGLFKYDVLEIRGVGKVQRLIDSDRQNMRVRDDFVAFDVAVVL